MKRNLEGLMAVGMLGVVALSSCVSDEPFGGGQGELRMKMVVNSTLTRSGDNLTDQELADKCVIYVSSSKGLIYKYEGVDNLPSSLYMKSGSYVAEAWTGDSVPASFDKKFYRAYEPFAIQSGQTSNVVINCRFANVVASVNVAGGLEDVIKDYKVTVGHSNASLDFTAENIGAKAYFMMPSSDTNLSYTITGTLSNGEKFTKEGTIWNVERAHEYTLNLNYTGTSSDPFGGAFITVTIDDTELMVEDSVVISGAPVFSGVGYDLGMPMLCEPGKFERRSVYVQALKNFRSLSVRTDDFSVFGLPGAEVDFIGLPDAARQQWAAAGISCSQEELADGTFAARIFLDAPMLNRLPEGVYTMRLTAVDGNAKRRERTLTINVSDAGVVLVETPWYDIYAHTATVYATVAREDMVKPGFRYREAGASDWITVDNVSLTGANLKASLTGLKSGTRYEYQAVAEGYVNPASMFFTTESVFVLPNAGFESWSTSSENGAIVPSASGKVEFWDSGNHGSITLKKNVTTGVTSLYHGGSMSACLKSQYVGIGDTWGGKFAAGNLFAGSFDGLSGMNGKLTFGRPYNGSRPVKLRGWLYYHPGIVGYSENDDKHPDVLKNMTDRGIVYVALTNQTVKVDTGTKELFDPNAGYVLAYGQLVLSADYGSSTAMREFEITLEYRDAARLQRATHLVLVASASQYGDYFTGSKESVMYIDDLELVY